MFIKSKLLTEKEEIIWLSGILEGEGWFGIQGGITPAINVKMTDEDIIIRVANIFETRVGIRQSKLDKAMKASIRYYANVHGFMAASLMIKVYPMMGKRRKAKIKEVIEQYISDNTHYKFNCRKYGFKLELPWQNVIELPLKEEAS